MVGNNSLGRQVDLLFGGGSCYFRPVPHPQSCRSDSVDVFQMAQNIGWNVIDKQQFDEISLDTKLPLMSLFAPDMMAYDIDRDPVVEPSLTEMASTALRLVNKASKERSTGFFIMIEGSRIDMAAHSNDPAAHLRDILEYNRAVAAVKKFVDQNPDTVMISVSDHETGGFTVASSADPQYIWYPEMLAPVKHSGEYIAREILSTTAANKATHVRNSVLKSYLGISNPDESDILFLSSQTATFEDLDRRIGAISARRANLGFTTHGHTAVDVNLYAYGVNSHLLRGNRENTEIGDFIKKSLRLDLDYITQKLNLDLGETPLDPDYPNTHH